MTNFVPLFPLNLVVYPGEQVNLHIFEPRYKQLIHDCYDGAKPFGIPAVVKNNIAEMGTLVQVTEIVKEYPDGKMDIRTLGLRVFRILELIKSVPDKEYSGAIVNYPDTSHKTNTRLQKEVLAAIRSLHKLLNVTKVFPKKDNELNSYDLAHHAGLTMEEEYRLLELMHESQRLEFLKQHLSKALPMVKGMEGLKEKIQLNGHFKELKGFNFDF